MNINKNLTGVKFQFFKFHLGGYGRFFGVVIVAKSNQKKKSSF